LPLLPAIHAGHLILGSVGQCRSIAAQLLNIWARWLFSMSQGISPTIGSHAEEIDLFGPLVRRQVFSASSISLNARPSKVGTVANVDSIALATGMI
jgi:hypothetical protein